MSTDEVAKLAGKGASVLMRAKFPGGGGVAYMDLGAGGLTVELIQRRNPGAAPNESSRP